MVSVKEVLVVEGRYDKNTLSQIVDATIVCTDGFSIFRAPERQEMLRRLAERRGLIILTDSDGAGRVIRGFLNGIVDPKCVKNAFIPDVPGKERRKAAPSKEGKLGVGRRAGALRRWHHRGGPLPPRSQRRRIQPRKAPQLAADLSPPGRSLVKAAFAGAERDRDEGGAGGVM